MNPPIGRDPGRVVDTRNMRLRQFDLPRDSSLSIKYLELLEDRLDQNTSIAAVDVSASGVMVQLLDQNDWTCNNLLSDFVNKQIHDVALLATMGGSDFEEISDS